MIFVRSELASVPYVCVSFLRNGENGGWDQDGGFTNNPHVRFGGCCLDHQINLGKCDCGRQDSTKQDSSHITSVNYIDRFSITVLGLIISALVVQVTFPTVY